MTTLQHRVYLLKTKGCMPGRNAFTLGMTQRIEHAVMRVNWRKTVLVQLVLYDVDQFLHPIIILRPITDDLRRQHQPISSQLRHKLWCN